MNQILLPLEQLPRGESALIRRIHGHPDFVHRLKEFGLREGTAVEMFRCGNPCIVRLSGHKVCLRPDAMLNVLVEPIAAKHIHHAAVAQRSPAKDEKLLAAS